MTAAPGLHRGRTRAAFFGAVSAVVGLDQLSKHWALNRLDSGPVDIVGSLRLNLTFNDGAAFSLGGGRTTWIALLALAVASVIAVLGWRATQVASSVGFGIILGGALGNLVDRALRAGDGFLGGHVVDFVDLGWWPVFNVADVSLWVGIAVLFVTSWRQPDDGASEPREAHAP